MTHLYFSTYCFHELHERCRLRCKTCHANCICKCHGEAVKSFGNLAYDGYSKSVGGKSAITGDTLPEFKKLPVRIKQAWEAAGEAVRKAIHEDEANIQTDESKGSPDSAISKNEEREIKK